MFGDDGGARQLATVTGDVDTGYVATLTVPVDTATEPTGGGAPGGGGQGAPGGNPPSGERPSGVPGGVHRAHRAHRARRADRQKPGLGSAVADEAEWTLIRRDGVVRMLGKTALTPRLWRIDEHNSWSAVHPRRTVGTVPRIEWAVGGAFGTPVRLDWIPQPAERAAYRMEYAWTGPAGTAARLTSALKGWQRMRFEATEEASDGVEAHRYSYTPALGVLHTQIGLHGDVVMPRSGSSTRW